MPVYESIFFTFIYFLNEWRYFNETDQNCSVPGQRETNDIGKATGSKVKVSQR